MCKARTVLRIICAREGHSLTEEEIMLADAQAEDTEKMESKLKNIQETMATKQDITDLKNQIIPLAKDAAKWELVKSLFLSAKTYLIIAGVISVLFGVRYLAHVTGIFDKL